MAYRPDAPSFRVAGTPVLNPIIDVRTVVGPASYAAGGIPVDLSAVFAGTLKAVAVIRAYKTSDNTPAPFAFMPIEAGTDTLANRKFRVSVANTMKAHTPAGAVAAPVFTGTPLGNFTPAGTVAAPTLNLANGAVGNVSITIPAGNNQAIAEGLTGGAGASTGHTGIQAPAFTGTPASPGTPAGTNSAPAFTGTAIAAAGLEEVAAAVDLSAYTIVYVAEGT